MNGAVARDGTLARREGRDGEGDQGNEKVGEGDIVEGGWET